MKKWIMLGLAVGSIVGGWIGSLLDGTGFGAWSILLSTIGSIAGIWLGYKVAQNLD